MCGICGILNLGVQSPVELKTLEDMSRVIAHRGPDDSGLYLEKGFGIASRRLAIQDLSQNGHMPMTSTDGRYQIIYNGEVYNFAELRAGLESRGIKFRSQTDTEVLLNMYILYGPEMLSRCNGMFAIAIWDTWEHTLFLARDRMGIKPLFYTVHDGRFFFASEEKALFAAGVRAEFDDGVWPELLYFRYVAGERTPYCGVRRLLPGHYILIQNGEIQTHCWWNLGDAARSAPSRQSATQATEELFDLLNCSVQLRRISDVPVGVLLSGGLDSGGIAALMAQQSGAGVESFTVRFDQREYDEGELARQVAGRYGLKYHELFLSPQNIPALLQEATYLLDQPIVHGNDLHILAISRFAKPLVTVLLSGEGADEVLGGYVRYRLFLYESIFGLLSPGARMLRSALHTHGRGRKTLELLALTDPHQRLLFSSAEVFPDFTRLIDFEPALSYRSQVARLARDIYQQGTRQAMFYELHTYIQSVLDRNDRMTMGASLECREPYLDYKLIEWAARLPQHLLFENGIGKAALRRAMKTYLPSSILRHKKWGFGVPWQVYFRQLPALRAWVETMHTQAAFETLPGGRDQVRVGARRFLSGDDSLTPLVRQWVMISLWHRQKIEGQPEPLAPLTPSQRLTV